MPARAPYRERQQGAASTRALRTALANGAILLRETRRLRLRLGEPQFVVLQEMLEAQVESLAEGLARIAARARALPSRALGTLSEIARFATLREPRVEARATHEALAALLDDHELVLVRLRRDARRCVLEAEDRRTAAVLEDVVAAHESMVWMLLSVVDRHVRP